MARAADAVEDWLGEPLWDFAAKSAGVGLSGTFIEIIKAQGWAEGVGDEILEAILGLALRKWGDKAHEQLPNVGSGILYHLVGRVVFEERIAPIFTEKMLGKKAYPSSQINQAFKQKYGRDPNQKEQQQMMKVYAQREPIAQQQVQNQAAPLIDYHYCRP